MRSQLQNAAEMVAKYAWTIIRLPWIIFEACVDAVSAMIAFIYADVGLACILAFCFPFLLALICTWSLLSAQTSSMIYTYVTLALGVSGIAYALCRDYGSGWSRDNPCANAFASSLFGGLAVFLLLAVTFAAGSPADPAYDQLRESERKRALKSGTLLAPTDEREIIDNGEREGIVTHPPERLNIGDLMVVRVERKNDHNSPRMMFLSPSTWKGALPAAGTKVKIEVRYVRAAEGSWNATMGTWHRTTIYFTEPLDR